MAKIKAVRETLHWRNSSFSESEVEVIVMTVWSRVLLDKWSVAQLLRSFPPVTEPEVSLPCSYSAIVQRPEAEESTPHLPTPFRLNSLILHSHLPFRISD